MRQNAKRTDTSYIGYTHGYHVESGYPSTPKTIIQVLPEVRNLPRDEINAAGGVNGMQVELVHKDELTDTLADTPYGIG